MLQQTPLRRALLTNTAFSVATGAACLLGSGPLAAWIGAADPRLIWALGPGLLGFAALTAWTATRPSVDPRVALAISIADVGWGVGSVALVSLARGLTPGGIALILGVAAVVQAIAAAQLRGIARLHRGDGSRGPHRSQLIMSRRIEAPAPAVWTRISDVGRYAAVAPNLRSSEVVSGSGADLVRRCTDHAGDTWEERAALWDEGRAFAFDVQTGASDYPYPFETLRGEWRVAPEGEASRLTMRFDFTLPRGWLGELMVAMAVVPKFKPVVTAILDTWQAEAEAAAAPSSPLRRAAG